MIDVRQSLSDGSRTYHSLPALEKKGLGRSPACR